MKRLLLTLCIMHCASCMYPQNPIIRDQFSADPTARVFNGRVYVFPSHDIPAPDEYERKDWFCMGDYHVFSSENLTDWTDHGVILDQKDVEWTNQKSYSMWAPDCIERTDCADGSTAGGHKYYFFFPANVKNGRGFGVGVAEADRPEGPYTPRTQNIEGVNGIDPSVIKGADGNWYIYWGGGGLMCARLTDDFTRVHPDEKVEEVEFMGHKMQRVGVKVDATLPEGFKEGPFVFQRGGKYYLTYPWVAPSPALPLEGEGGEKSPSQLPNSSKKKGDSNSPSPSRGRVGEGVTECLAYAMSDSPYGPFEYKGLIMEEHRNGCWTNHHSIVEYNGQWYLFYHHNDYSPNFDKNRSVCCDSLFFNPDGTIQLVKPTLRGVGLTDARGLIQIDRYSHFCGGPAAKPSVYTGGDELSYLDTLDYFKGWAITYKGEAYSTYGNVDFGQQEVTTITVRAKAPMGGTLMVTDITSKMPTSWGGRKIPKEFLDNMKKNWGRVASVTVPASAEYQLITLPINQSPRGVVDLKFHSADGRELAVDWVGFDLKPSQHPALLESTQLRPWQKGGMETGQYRNLFAELGYTEAQIDAKLNELFDALFCGPDKIYFECEAPSPVPPRGEAVTFVSDRASETEVSSLPLGGTGEGAFISDVKNHDVRTEGMSYGMMIAVQLDRKDIFDRLWRWAKEYMQMKDGRQKGYFAWSVRPDGTNPARGAAADGELYFATSLIFASNRWGNDTGIDYLKEAQYILDTCLGSAEGGTTNKSNTERNTSSKGRKRGVKEERPRLFDQKTGLICFVPGAGYTDPSYHIPAFYEVWARYAQDGRSDYWQQCAQASREYLHRSIHPVTGLNNDYNNFDGTVYTGNPYLGNGFRYDSWRVPMNIALDYSWSCADREWQTQYGHRLQNFLYSQGIDTFLDQYNIDGTAITDTLSAGGFKELRHTPGLIATTAALSLVCSHAKARDFVDLFWNSRHEPSPSGYFDAYYEGILRLFAAMHLSGRYRVIEPRK